MNAVSNEKFARNITKNESLDEPRHFKMHYLALVVVWEEELDPALEAG